MCPHDRIVRLSVSGTDYWICNVCNEQFIQKSAVDYKLSSLGNEVLRLQSLELVMDRMASHLSDCIAICPGDWEDSWELLQQYGLMKGSNEQAARVREQEVF